MKETVLAYISAINEHDIDTNYDLMPEDYLDADTYASEIPGYE